MGEVKKEYHGKSDGKCGGCGAQEKCFKRLVEKVGWEMMFGESWVQVESLSSVLLVAPKFPHHIHSFWFLILLKGYLPV